MILALHSYLLLLLLETHGTQSGGHQVQSGSKIRGYWRSLHLWNVGQTFERGPVNLVIQLGKVALFN